MILIAVGTFKLLIKHKFQKPFFGVSRVGFSEVYSLFERNSNFDHFPELPAASYRLFLFPGINIDCQSMGCLLLIYTGLPQEESWLATEKSSNPDEHPIAGQN